LPRFFRQSQDQKTKGRKHLAMNRQQIPLRAAKVLFSYNQDEWLPEIEEQASEKQLVEMSSLKLF